MVNKADGSIRITCNYKRLNDSTIIPVLPLPQIEQLLDELGGAKIFSCLDITSGYFNVAIHQDSIPLTAVCTQSGLYEWLVMPMGCSGSPGWFQSIMARICDGLERCRLYIDDVCTFSESGAQHVTDLERLFERLTKFNLKLAPKKAHVGAKETKFLGHEISAQGISPDQKKVQALRQMPMPTDVSQLRSLLGGLGYYRKFIPRMAARIKPLTNLLRKKAKFEFTSEHETVVKDMLASLTGSNVLAFPDYDGAISGQRPFMLVTRRVTRRLGGRGRTMPRRRHRSPSCFSE